ncbi:MAG: hypothetical protein H6835_16890 [Planctomycetes bacterium]|nr:hypothetical protein [Planctomycetota bacterium]
MNSPTRARRLLPLLLLLLAALPGCLEFDGQEVTLRYDAANDRIDAMFVYRGLFAESGNGSSDRPLDKALKDLDKAFARGEFAFWCNWPLRVDPSADLTGPRQALLAHVLVENGGLFTDPTGVLCAYQFVRIERAKAFVQSLNTMLELALKAATVTDIGLFDGKHQLDDDTEELLTDFLRSRGKLLELEQGRITLRLPFSAKDHAWFKAGIEDHFLDNMPGELIRRRATAARRKNGQDVTDTSAAEASVSIDGPELREAITQAPSYRFFWDNEISIVRELELTTLGIGVAGADELRVVKRPDGFYHDALLQKLRERGDEIEDGVPDQELTRRFAEFLTRDARLPTELAAKRR